MMDGSQYLIGVGFTYDPATPYQRYWSQNFAGQSQVATLDESCLVPPTSSPTPGDTCIFEEEEHEIVSDANGVFQELNQCHFDMEDSCACASRCQEDANHLSFHWKPSEAPNCCCFVFA